jgi:hypothetical protein
MMELRDGPQAQARQIHSRADLADMHARAVRRRRHTRVTRVIATGAAVALIVGTIVMVGRRNSGENVGAFGDATTAALVIEGG